MKGQATFVCPECGLHFKSADIDYRATDMAIPMACPQCGTRTRDKYWNQTNIPDGWLITLAISCLVVPVALWKGMKRLFAYINHKRFVRTIVKDEEKETIIEKIYNFFTKNLRN